MENHTFYPGQKVVCVAGGWYKNNCWTRWDRLRYVITGKRPPSVGPKKGESCTVEYVATGDDGGTYIALIEWPSERYGIYIHSSFRPIDTLTEQVERIEKEGAPLELETY